MKKYVNGQYIEMTSAEIAEMAEASRQAFYEDMERPLTTDEKIRMVVESIPQMDKPVAREGFLWRPIYDATQNVFAWEEIADPYYVPTEDGSYLHPYAYADGMAVESGKWYRTEDGDIWECIKTDSTSHMTTEWFDII